MCQICTLALRQQRSFGASRSEPRPQDLLNPKPLSVLVMLNPPPAKPDLQGNHDLFEIPATGRDKYRSES